jgi:glycosyltransferase involved in cell wall biosynthesis
MKIRKKNILKLFQDPVEDKRISIDLYFKQIHKEIGAIKKKNTIIFSGYKFPNILPDFFNIKFRISRYIFFPLYFLITQKKINHILDQSYGHLLFFKLFSKNIITVHDLIPLLAWKKKIDSSIYKSNPLLFKLSLIGLKKADKIVAVSQSTKDDIIRELGINPSKITVIHNGVSKNFRPFDKQRKAEAKKYFNLNNDSFKVLIVGNSLYKNIESSFEVIKKANQITKKSLHLVWLGGSYQYQNIIEKKLGKLGTTTIVTKLNESECIKLYNSVDCLLFPSYYEGFGLPPLEAMSCGIPVISSNIKVFKELYDDAAMMANPKDTDSMCNFLLQIIDDDQHRANLIDKGLNRANNFSWEKAAKKLNNIYESI